MRNIRGLILLLPFLAGCGITEPMRKSETKLSMLNLGDDKAATQRILGPADRVRASRKLEDGTTFELHEYDIFGRYKALGDALMCPLTFTVTCWWTGPTDKWATPYWLQYVNGKLDKWGRAGDWQPTVSGELTIRQR